MGVDLQQDALRDLCILEIWAADLPLFFVSFDILRESSKYPIYDT